MGRKPDYIRKKYGPLRERSLQNVIAHRIHKEFPRIGGPRIRELCAAMILEVIENHEKLRETVSHGQVLWMAVATDSPPKRHQRIQDTDLVPVTLDLSTPADIERRIERTNCDGRLLSKAIRLCQQAYDQGGLLSNCDLAELLNTADSRIAHLLAQHERDTGRIVPRRATLHDVGTGVTHKVIICRSRFVEGKEPSQIARDTYHTIESVDRYLGQYDRVRFCKLHGMSSEDTSRALNCSHNLVLQYLHIDKQMEARHD
jgi:hypothetical protein